MQPGESSTQNIVGPLTSAAVFLVLSVPSLTAEKQAGKRGRRGGRHSGGGAGGAGSTQGSPAGSRATTAAPAETAAVSAGSAASAGTAADSAADTGASDAAAAGLAAGTIPQNVVDTLAGVEDLVKTVGFRNPGARLSCTVGIGSVAWDALHAGQADAAPVELHPFKEFVGKAHAARATPGDLLFHIRADRQDLAYELERLLLAAFGDDVRVEDEVSGFRYFDGRDLLGFVDGTANPVGPDLPVSALIGDEDPKFAGGSYVVVQKYLHDLSGWGGLTVEDQEAVIGRTKSDNVELPDAESGQRSHKTLATITDAEGVEHDIVRDNMPFATPGSGIHGTYFIGYSRRLSVIEQMLERMFIGDPPGKHDRILDFSTAATGSTYFVPTAQMLAALGD